MLSYQNAVTTIVSTLHDFGRPEDVIRLYKSFFSSFSDFIDMHSETGNLEEAYLLWKHEMFPTLSKDQQQIATSASEALIYTVQTGHIPYDFCNTLPSKQRLVPEHYAILCDYVTYAKSVFSRGHLPNIETRCSVFLFWAQVNGIRQIADLNYEFLQLFYESHNYSLSASKGMALSTIEAFLMFLAEKGLIPYAYPLFLNTYRHPCLLDISAMSPTDKKTIDALRSSSLQDFPAEEFFNSSKDFCSVLQEHRYEKTICSTWKMTAESLYLFLHRNNLGYESEIVKIWYAYFQQSLSPSSLNMSRRLLKLFEQYLENNDINPMTIFSYSASSLDCLASWCKPAVIAFLNRKKKEQCAASTIAMYKSSILRFCNWLDENGIDSYNKITYKHIKQFDIEDPHNTAEGKAAYNSRIRVFLMYLEEVGLVSGHLFKSVPTAYSKRDRMVVVLTEEQLALIDTYVTNATTELELRDSAMILLGLKMGLRSVDVSGLKLSEIDWKNRSIRFVQQKTKVEVNLPMPISVGNAIYKYLLVKPDSKSSPYVFVSCSQRRYPLSRHTCIEALHRAIPGSHVGFHCLRKTFSSGLLERGVKAAVIDDALGHTSNDELDRYLALDEKRMMMCPLQLSDEGIGEPGRLLP